MSSLREPVTFEQAMAVAVGLRGDADSNPEYDRGMCELIADLWPKHHLAISQRAQEIAETITLIATIGEMR